MATEDSASRVDWAGNLLEDAEDMPTIQRILRSSGPAGVQAQGATVVLLENDHCRYLNEDAMSPLWKGQRFPVSARITGWAMIHRQTVVAPDIAFDNRIPQDAYRPTFVRSLAAPIQD